MSSVAIEQASKSELVHGYKALKGRMAKYKEHAERAAGVTMNALASTAGGALAGALNVKFPVIPNTNVPTDMAAGIVCVGLALADMGGKYNEPLNNFGSGLLAVAAAREVSKMLNK